ncbi:MAG: hypothetical protein ACODAQ_04480 [Phycisphaeraceae bacterium]
MSAAVVESSTLAVESDSPRASVGPRFIVWLLVLTALAAGLRLPGLGTWSLWEDELYSVRSALSEHTSLARQPAYAPIKWGIDAGGGATDEVIPPHTRERTADGYPPADDWRAAGIEAFNMRIVPALIGIISVPLLTFFSVRLLGVGGAAVLGLLLVLSPWHVFWSQASRFYAQQFLFYNLALIFYFTATQRGSTLRFLLAAVVLVVAMLTQPPALLIGLVFAGDFLWGVLRREPPRIPLAGWLLLAVAIVVMAYLVLRFITGGGFEYWASLDGHSAPTIVLGVIYRNHPIIAAAAGLAALALWRRAPRLVPYLAMGAVLPALVMVVLALMPDLYAHTRYTFIVHYSWLALAALGLAQLYEAIQPRLGRFAALTPVALVITPLMLSLFVYYTVGYGNRARWGEALAYIQEHRQADEDVASERRMIATYYLETTELTEFPLDREALEALDRPTWLVMLMGSARVEMRFPHIHYNAELREYFDVRVLQPYSSVRVYYYDPARAGE